MRLPLLRVLAACQVRLPPPTAWLALCAWARSQAQLLRPLLRQQALLVRQRALLPLLPTRQQAQRTLLLLLPTHQGGLLLPVRQSALLLLLVVVVVEEQERRLPWRY